VEKKEHEIKADQKAFESIIEKIMNKEILPGERIYETDLERLTGFSRTPLRQALSRLVTEGIFQKKRGKKGYFFPKLSIEDLNNVFLARAALEGMAAGLAAKNRNEEDIEDLLAINEKEKDLFFEERDKEEYARLNNSFHEKILTISRNPYLEQYGKRAYWRSDVYILLHGSFYKLEKLPYSAPHKKYPTWKEHRKIIAAIEKQDFVEARQSMEEHIFNTLNHRLGWIYAEKNKIEL
jgi:DNA-binding GntR family transcriptional regulator